MIFIFRYFVQCVTYFDKLFFFYFQAIKHRKYKEIFLACIVLVNLVITYSYNGADLRGSYCASRRNGCCQGRQDECSAPILGTLCYCDDFCNRTRNDDCCPDYLSFCRGLQVAEYERGTCIGGTNTACFVKRVK